MYLTELFNYDFENDKCKTVNFVYEGDINDLFCRFIRAKYEPRIELNFGSSLKSFSIRINKKTIITAIIYLYIA